MKNIVPEWFKKASIYQINPRTFSSEGTIKSVTKELPFLASLGFKIMYLCPVFEEDDSMDINFWSERQKKSETNNPKNPYRMNDYFKIDTEYGNMDDLQEFVKESHRLGMKVILDLVYFHIGPNAPILKAHPEFTNTDADGNIILGEWHFPLFNYESNGVREYLWSNMVYYIGEIGADGFRCDVAQQVPLDFWREGKRRIKTINPQAIMINEGEKAEYLTVFDANYGFYWHGLIYELLNKKITGSDVAEKYKSVAKDYPKNAIILRHVDTHDSVTDLPYRIEEHFGNDCMELILALNYSIDGVPMVYCGNELADTARVSMFANRFFMGKFEVTNRDALKQTAPTKRRIETIKILNQIKSDYPAFIEGKTKWIKTENPYILAFNRICENQKITFVCNFSQESVNVALNPSGEVLLSHNAVTENCTLTFAPYGYIIIKE